MAKKLQASTAALEELQRTNEANTKLIQVNIDVSDYMHPASHLRPSLLLQWPFSWLSGLDLAFCAHCVDT